MVQICFNLPWKNYITQRTPKWKVSSLLMGTMSCESLYSFSPSCSQNSHPGSVSGLTFSLSCNQTIALFPFTKHFGLKFASQKMWTKFCWGAAGHVGKTYVKLWLVRFAWFIESIQRWGFTEKLHVYKQSIINHVYKRLSFWNPNTFTKYVCVLNRLPLSTSYTLECLQGLKAGECVSYPCDCPWNRTRRKQCYWERVIFAKLHTTEVIFWSLSIWAQWLSDTKFI